MSFPCHVFAKKKTKHFSQTTQIVTIIEAVSNFGTEATLVTGDNVFSNFDTIIDIF